MGQRLGGGAVAAEYFPAVQRVLSSASDGEMPAMIENCCRGELVLGKRAEFHARACPGIW